MPQPGSDEHHGRMPVGEAARPPADLLHDPLQTVVCTYPEPMLGRKVHVGQCLLDTLLDKFGDNLQLHSMQLFGHEGGLFPGGLLVLLRVDRLQHGGDRPRVPRGAFLKALRYQCTMQCRHFASGWKSPGASTKPDVLSETTSLTLSRPRSFRYRKKFLHDSPFSRFPPRHRGFHGSHWNSRRWPRARNTFRTSPASVALQVDAVDEHVRMIAPDRPHPP